jgi:hypothetical protein
METSTIVRCADCGARLLDRVTPGAVVTVEGERVPFRRHTDHVVCSCLASYRVTDLREVVFQVESRMRPYRDS